MPGHKLAASSHLVHHHASLVVVYTAQHKVHPALPLAAVLCGVTQTREEAVKAIYRGNVHGVALPGTGNKRTRREIVA